MSAQVRLRCDALNGVMGRCHAAYGEQDARRTDRGGTAAAWELREDAARFGWTSWRGDDLCPAHRLAGAR